MKFALQVTTVLCTYDKVRVQEIQKSSFTKKNVLHKADQFINANVDKPIKYIDK